MFTLQTEPLPFHFPFLTAALDCYEILLAVKYILFDMNLNMQTKIHNATKNKEGTAVKSYSFS